MSQQFKDEVEILEDRIINFLKEKYDDEIKDKIEFCCPDKTREKYIEESNNDINIYKNLLIDYYSKIISQPYIMEDLTLHANDSVQSLEENDSVQSLEENELPSPSIQTYEPLPSIQTYEPLPSIQTYEPLPSRKNKRSYNSVVSSIVRKDKNNAGPTKMIKPEFDFKNYKPTDFNFGGKKKSKKRKYSKKRRKSRKRRRSTKRRR